MKSRNPERWRQAKHNAIEQSGTSGLMSKVDPFLLGEAAKRGSLTPSTA
jgi:hypothetical protein